MAGPRVSISISATPSLSCILNKYFIQWLGYWGVFLLFTCTKWFSSSAYTAQWRGLNVLPSALWKTSCSSKTSTHVSWPAKKINSILDFDSYSKINAPFKLQCLTISRISVLKSMEMFQPGLCTIVAGPVQWGIALAVCHDRECFQWLGSMQEASQYPNVATRCCQVDRRASFTVLCQEVCAVLKQSLDTFIVASHSLQPEK